MSLGTSVIVVVLESTEIVLGTEVLHTLLTHRRVLICGGGAKAIRHRRDFPRDAEMRELRFCGLLHRDRWKGRERKLVTFGCQTPSLSPTNARRTTSPMCHNTSAFDPDALHSVSIPGASVSFAHRRRNTTDRTTIPILSHRRCRRQ